MPERELRKVKNRVAADNYRRLESNMSLFIQLAFNEALLDWREINEVAGEVRGGHRRRHPPRGPNLFQAHQPQRGDLPPPGRTERNPKQRMERTVNIGREEREQVGERSTTRWAYPRPARETYAAPEPAFQSGLMYLSMVHLFAN